MKNSMADQNTQNILHKVCHNSCGACTDSFAQKKYINMGWNLRHL